ncbi:F-box protein At3g56470-like [Apium graveolens]|uniref:F-box protein At3g56470-like n=1 Tax=Apium graveolens TaxID=4045 RepID=UPI003D7BC03F
MFTSYLNIIMQKLRGATKRVIKLLSHHKREREQAAEEEKQQTDDINLWSELDGNLLGEILSRLCFADQFRFRVVCKNWLAARPINTKTLLPWYLCINRSAVYEFRRFDFQLYDPSSPNPVSVLNISLTKLGIPFSSYMTYAATVKHNWLFICIERGKWFTCLSHVYFRLFSPFARKISTLPKLTHPRAHPLHFTMTWSTQPDSPDCVFYLLDTCNIPKIALFTYRNGDKNWTATQFDEVQNFWPHLCSLVYLHGVLYIVSPTGKIVSYDIVGREFKFECLLIDELLALHFSLSRKQRVLELDGEVMIVCLGSYVDNNVTLTHKPCIKRYNRSSKAWIPVSTLGNRALFVSDKTYEVAKIDTIDMRNSGVLSNKIFHFFDGRCLVYSIEDGELVEFKPADSNLLEDNGSDLSEYKNRFFGTFSDANSNKSVFWLEPPCVHVCST